MRARRCATTQSIAEATRKGSIPISMRRVIAVGASFVCSVREDEVAGERGLDGDLRRLAVADLARP